MYPRTYYETFMRYEASDEVFVAMPFTDEFEKSFKEIIAPAVGEVTLNGRPLKAIVINRSTVGSADIHEKIYEAIIHSRLVIADMSVQSRYNVGGKERWQANANVAYEVGLATAWRNPEDILLVHRPHANHAYSFDIQNLRHVEYDSNNCNASAKLLTEEVFKSLERSTFIARRSFESLLNEVSPSAVRIMHSETKRVFPAIIFNDVDGNSIFDSRQHAIDQLLRLGAIKSRNIIRTKKDGKSVVAIIYKWTELGYRLMAPWKAADKSRVQEMRELAASVLPDQMPPQDMLDLPAADQPKG